MSFHLGNWFALVAFEPTTSIQLSKFLLATDYQVEMDLQRKYYIM